MTTLADFVKQARRELARFERNWKRYGETDPDAYPPVLPDEEWWEQFLIGETSDEP